ncbi:nucleolar protein 16 [Xylona heveae TC161]|uniref:Nucleolar protein 16 n=1 Tax=Xylona heveae (strain CBS 132557 / TC161) TaxID=1328760 RepID=A0A165HIJ5_XYLHT|nr:nucleolar protein 16 [Xylona heveae TC161]KZF23571.1 nucleolar protein 16 [Xylona heveae TC161]
MGRELQKKKNRSSISKVRQKPKSKKLNIKSNPIIAANWRQDETLSQNYRRLGLTAKLNRSTGGTEKDPVTGKQANDFAIRNARSDTLQPKEAQVERDPETGAILRVIPPADEKPNPLKDPLNELEDEDEQLGIQEGPNRNQRSSNSVIAALEEQAAHGIKKEPRKQSSREEEWIEKLVQKYGDDCEKMFWDRKLNPMQQSVGDLKKRVKKWKQTHGKE